MRTYLADLHIHSCFSPCGSLRMTPQAIVDTAVEKGIELIAVTDHNTAAITPYVAKLARARGLAFLYGLELQTQEDVHLLAYFDDEATCLAFSDEVYSLLPHSTHDPYGLSDQRLVDDAGRLLRVEERFLVNGLSMSFVEIVERVWAAGGFPVPAHVDRDLFSVKSGLGSLPLGLDLPLVEIRESCTPELCRGAAVLKTSDAHDLEHIGRRVTHITFDAPTIDEFRLAAKAVNGRSLQASG